GDELGDLGIDGHRLELRVDAAGEVPAGHGVLPLEVLEGEVSSLAESAARVLAEVAPPLVRRAWCVVEKEPGPACVAAEPQAGPWSGGVEDVLLGLCRAEGGNASFGQLHLHGA